MPVDKPADLWAGSNYPGVVNTFVNSPGKNAVGNLTWTISPRVVNEVEFVWSQGTTSRRSSPARTPLLLRLTAH